METQLTAKDLWPLVQKLTPEEQRRLATLALGAASTGDPGDAYRAMPPTPGEFSSEDEPLAWDGEGWEEFDATR